MELELELQKKKVVDCNPVGSKILVEMLTTQELLNTKLYVGGKADKKETPQAYILKIGPALRNDPKFESNYGFKEGDRVIITGTFVPVTNFDNSERDKGLVDPHAISAVLIED